MYLIQGKNYPSLTPEEAIAMLTSGLDSALSQPPRPETVLACAGRFIEQLKDHAFLPQLGPAYREEVRKFCQPDALRQKLEHELGDNPFSVRRINYREPQFEGWRPLGVVVHVTPANAELLPFFAIIESLLVGNINWLRPSASEQGMTIDLLRAFIHCDLTDQLANFVAVVPVETTRLSLLLTHADGISAWGGDTALEAIRQQLPGGCRWIHGDIKSALPGYNRMPLMKKAFSRWRMTFAVLTSRPVPARKSFLLIAMIRRYCRILAKDWRRPCGAVTHGGNR